MENSGVVHMLKNNKTDGRCTVSFCKTDLLFPSAQNKAYNDGIWNRLYSKFLMIDWLQDRYVAFYKVLFEFILSKFWNHCFTAFSFVFLWHRIWLKQCLFFLQTLPVCTSYLFGYQRVWRLCVSVLVCIWGSRAKPLCRRKGRTPRMQSHLYRSVAIKDQRTRSLCITFEHVIVHFMK